MARAVPVEEAKVKTWGALSTQEYGQPAYCYDNTCERGMSGKDIITVLQHCNILKLEQRLYLFQHKETHSQRHQMLHILGFQKDLNTP